MALQLLSSQGKRGVDYGLLTRNIDIEDNSYLSRYFDVVEFSPVFTAGKNCISFNGTSLLAQNSEILVQCIDSNGNSLYLERARGKTQFIDVANHVISVHVYNETYNGPGKVILVGTTSKGEIVRWIANISIDKTLQNVSKTRFYNTPTIEARSLLYPVISNDIASQLTHIISFSGSFYSNAILPQKDTIQSYINPKNIDIDYRLTMNVSNPFLENSLMYPTTSMNTQMEGQDILLTTNIIQRPFSYTEQHANISSSFKIKKVIDNKTIQLSNAFFFPYGKDRVVTNINVGQFTSSYKWVSYNTASDSYKTYHPPTGSPILAKESYAEIIYRNIKPFTGFIARHKLYRKSLLYPGDFQLIADESLGVRETLVDPVTVNKSYNLLGNFYNKTHIEKYWLTSSNDIRLDHTTTPRINGMRISSDNFNNLDGTKYIIAKLDATSGSFNDSTYYPYDQTQYNTLSGSSYNSNFISLKSGSLYAISFNLILEKDQLNKNSKLQFYFTSSIPDIQKEKNYISPFGLKLGEIISTENTRYKVYSDKIYLYFTPNSDYYGTLVIVPYQCGGILTEVSLGAYGDYGFSPDTLVTKVPFSVNTANEGWQLKAELYDINSTLVYSNLSTVQTFDKDGESLFVFVNNNIIDPSKVTFVSQSLTISESLFLPNIKGCPSENKRFLAWNPPINSPPGIEDGEICYSNLISVDLIPTKVPSAVTSKDYISITTTDGNGKSLIIHYNGNGTGKRIFIDNSGTKHVFQ